MMDLKLYTDLLELLNYQGHLIKKQNDVIVSLVNENAEKENMINVLMTEGVSV